MIMFPTQNLHKHHHHHHQQQQKQQQRHFDGYGGCGESYYYAAGRFDLMRKIQGYECYSEVCLESDLVLVVGDRMAEDGSRTSSLNEAGSSSKDVVQQAADDDSRDEKWLQLGLGSSVTGSDQFKLNQTVMEPLMTRRSSGLVELDLLSGTSTQDMKPLLTPPMFHMTSEFRPTHPPPPSINTQHTGNTNIISSMPLLIHQQPRTSLNLSHHHHHHQYHHQPDEIPWGSYRPNLWNNNNNNNPTVASSSSVPLGSYFSRSFQHPNIDMGAGPSSDDMMMKVVDAPPRPHSGIWFVLQASQNQSKEPFLPQIPKSYLRIKDRRMTVRLLMKYLVNKLRLNSELEIEIRCRGQQLEPGLTLQHVRDNIWNSKEMVTLLPDSSTTDHVMILHYARTSNSSSIINKTTTTTTTSSST